MQEQALQPSAFACPVHKHALGDNLFCTACAKPYPSVNGIPVLINDANSVFQTADYLQARGYEGASSYGGHLDNSRGWRQLYRRAIAALSESNPPGRTFDAAQAVKQIQAQQPDARVLVIGAGDSDIGGSNVVTTDVAFGAHVQCIADAHDLPFVDGSFDACIAIAVLEHVVDPYRCVEEIRRVLRPRGFVYAETPFMQPVHMGAYDFTRFSHLGHRRLFRHFDELDSGIVGGPGTSAGQMLRYVIASLSERAAVKRWLKLAALLLTYPMRWIDRICLGKLAAYDSASGFYFFGRLATEPLGDRELLALYRGG
ncbi:Methyltransferase family protein [Rubrivivax sp. A210]|uniref:class I SAM-dependent methyltransferase n=1 Tax=Rubrivivax sp. A210 TaxID=2772301 RepID=UPI001917B128|nr:class I SAM-dependent methyltransferase [Rubrivivax sp. A210]CAD5375221.1 Methyltransferase family protein [Rubrivivax sp. A210]